MSRLCHHDACGGRPSSLFSISCVCRCCRDVQAGARGDHHGEGSENCASHGTISPTPIREFRFGFGNGSLWWIHRQPARVLQAGPTSPVSHDLVGIVYDECLEGFFLHRSIKTLKMWSLFMCVHVFYPGAALLGRKMKTSTYHYVPPGT